MTIDVVDADPAWPQVFGAIRSELAAILADVEVLAIEHVGSTSVPGLAAKPIIDVDVVVRRELVARAIAAMEAGGYGYLGDMGIVDRHAFRAPSVSAAGARRNVYVVVDGSLSLRNHLGVRDVLRRDAELRNEYAALKRRLATQFTAAEIDAYVEAKSGVLRRVLARAGLTDDELSAIDEANRAG